MKLAAYLFKVWRGILFKNIKWQCIKFIKWNKKKFKMAQSNGNGGLGLQEDKEDRDGSEDDDDSGEADGGFVLSLQDALG